jgi:Mn2+/Fe2+ NRAMP family transporter
MILFSQVLIFMILLVNRKGLMGGWVNSRIYTIGMTLALVGITARDIWAG